MDINNIIEQIKPIDRQKVEEAQNRFDNLIKPVGSLAKLEAMVSRYAGIIGTADKKSANGVKINGARYNVLIGIMDFTQKKPHLSMIGRVLSCGFLSSL